MQAKNKQPLKLACIMLGSWKKSLGGREVFTFKLLRLLKQRGHDVTLYVSGESFRAQKELYAACDFCVRPLLYPTFVFIKVLPVLMQRFIEREQDQHNYQLWQVIGAYPGGYLTLRFKGRVPVVVRSHGDDIQKDASLAYGKRLAPQIERRIQAVVQHADKLVALTQGIADCYNELGVDPQRIIEIPNGVDTERFKPTDERQRLREKWGIRHDEHVLLTVGRNHIKKDFRIIPLIARALKTEHLAIRWFIVGQDTDQLRDLLKQEQVNDVVRTINHIDATCDVHTKQVIHPSDELLSLYQSADIFVMPSRLEAFCRTIIEAMATGVAVVTTRAPGCRFAVPSSQRAHLVTPGDVTGFAERIYYLIEHPAERRTIAKEGRAHALRYVTWNIVVDKYEAIYYELAGG